MKSRWSDDEARAMVARYGAQGVNEDVALRVYTTRLLGQDQKLVLHGGGNSSVKTQATDLLGRPVEVICVKGSGWDMGAIEPAGLPAVRLEPLRELIALEALDDAAMVAAHRGNLLDSKSPTPSVETLLHAFLPHKFVDHTHANAVLSLSDQPEGERICREVYGDRVVIVPYIMPGFDLARAADQAYRSRPECVGMILHKHGIFTFAEDARTSYERMIELVTLAEERLGREHRVLTAPMGFETKVESVAAIAPIVRGAVCTRDGRGGPDKRFVLEFRGGDAIRHFVDGPDLPRYAGAGVATPDHVIRIKRTPLILSRPHRGHLDAFAAATRDAVAGYAAAYRSYFERNAPRSPEPKTPLDPMPRLILVPGVGLFTAGPSARAARVAADVAEAMVEVILDAEAIGRFESIGESDTFDVEYWSLEQAKLGNAVEPPLARHVVVITGGAGTIGRAVARAFAAQGAEVALLDSDADAVESAGGDLGALAMQCDVTDPAAVRGAFARICEAYGGVDIVVSNAGGAWQGRIGEVDEAILRRSFELNFFAHQHVGQAAVEVMRRQDTGGVLLFNVSKQAVNPGPNFGPYGLPKAATMALVKQYAVDYGADGIRSNGVNADRIRSGILTDDMVATRAEARGVSEENYMSGNLLHREVTAQDVAEAFVSLARAEKTTGAIVPVDGGNIAASLR